MAAMMTKSAPFGNEGKGASSAKETANVDLPRKERISPSAELLKGRDLRRCPLV